MAGDRPSRRTLWLIPTAVLIHNIEEGLTFSAMWPTVQLQLANIGFRLWWDRPEAIVPALAIVAALALAVIAWAARRPTPIRLWAALLVQAVMLVNVAWHVIAAIVVMHGYTPGLITALAFNFPVSWYVFSIARRERWISTTAFLLLIPVAVLLHFLGVIALMMAAENVGLRSFTPPIPL
jgi:hypothetical protein